MTDTSTSRLPAGILAPLIALGGLGVLGAACVGTDADSSRSTILEVTVVDADVHRGAELYAKHCAVCHGSSGAGDGQGASALSPLARDFTAGRFRLVSTHNGVPTRADLVRVMDRGMPGSAMPSWSWMDPDDLDQLAAYVRHLAVEGIANDIDMAGFVEGRELTWEDAHAEAVLRMAPGERINPGRAAEPTAAVLARGAVLYRERCASCHGDDGKGRGDEPRADEDGNLTWARDFTAGILKGGSDYEDIACRIIAGLPGSSMPGTTLEPTDLAALVAYVQSLIPEGAETRHISRREVIRAAHTVAPTPTAPGDARWSEARETTLSLAPLWWHELSVFEARVAALHDGKTLGIRVSWPDTSRDDARVGGRPFSDAAALLLSTETNPPLFGMGSRRHPMNLWHWRASRWHQLRGILDLDAPVPHAQRAPGFDEERVDAPLYWTGPENSPTSDQTHSLRAQGVGAPGTLTEIAEGSNAIHTTPEWNDGMWSVVFLRRMPAGTDEEIAFSPGDRLQVAFAIWNGAANDGRGRKSISIWQLLDIDPTPPKPMEQ